MTSIDTGYRPHKFQLQIHMNLKRFSVLVCHRRFGKTFLAVNALIDAALRLERTDGRYAYVAPYLKQAKRIAWDYLKRFATKIPGTTVNESDLFVQLPNGSRIYLYGADNADAMRGAYFDGIVLDEFGDMRPNVWGEIIRPALADKLGWALFIGTPKGMNHFYELYLYALNDPEWYAGLYRVDETDILPKEEIESMRKEMTSESQYRQEMLCDFSASTDNTLITIDMVTDGVARAMRAEALHGLPRILGVDVARFGDDRSSIQKRWGPVALEPDVFTKMDNMQIVGHLVRIMEDWKPDAVFIDGGRGEGVIDRVRQLGHNVIEVNFGGVAVNPRYMNKRAEMWDLMRQWLSEGGCLPNIADLKTDLCVPTYRFNAMNKMELESKDTIKKRGMKSPDLADALALTFAFPVAPKAVRMSTNGGRGYTTNYEYDPLGD